MLATGSRQSEDVAPLAELQTEAEELSAMGVDGAAEIAELISTAMHAEDPVTPSE